MPRRGVGLESESDGVAASGGRVDGPELADQAEVDVQERASSEILAELTEQIFAVGVGANQRFAIDQCCALDEAALR